MYIKARVIVEAKREEMLEESSDHFLISVKVPAKRNLANARVRELLARHFKLPVSKVRIINGHHSPSKLLAIDIE
jgi:hypothetical protein